MVALREQISYLRNSASVKLSRADELGRDLLLLEQTHAASALEQGEDIRLPPDGLVCRRSSKLLVCLPPCGKRRHPSERSAMEANRTNGQSLRAYYSPACRCWHVSKAD
jgi:hypothetical protein